MDRRGGFSYSGAENLPPPGTSFIAASEHYSYLDIPVLARLFLEERGATVDALAKTELWRKKIALGAFGGALAILGAIKLERGKSLLSQPEARQKLDEAVAHNRIIEIFARGTRYKSPDQKPNDVFGGVGQIAAYYGLSISPIGIAGTAGWDRYPIHAHIGNQVEVPHFPDMFSDRRVFVKFGRQILPDILRDLDDNLRTAQIIAEQARQEMLNS